MKNKGLIMLVLVTLLLLNIISGCDGTPGITKPTVGYVPQNWYLSTDDAYGTWLHDDGTDCGLIEYIDEVDWDFVQIYYGDIPAELEGKENDGDALIAKAIERSAAFDPEETGTMVVAGQLAGYTKAYNAALGFYDMEIVFVKGSTCIDIYTIFDATTGEAQAMSLINSID